MLCKYCPRGATKLRRRPQAVSINPLTNDEVRLLIASLAATEVSDDLKDAAMLALNTGIRLGELRNLRWQDVNLPDLQVTVRSTASDDRHIPFGASIAEALGRRQHCLSSPEYVFGKNPAGTLMRAQRELKELGERVLGRVLTFHDLRRTFFSNLANSGTDPATIMSLSGWHKLPAYVVAALEATSKRTN